MIRRWRRRRSRDAAPSKTSKRPAHPEESSAPERGLKVRIEPQDDEAQGTEILAVLGKRYEVTALREGAAFLVIVDDALFADEAVVKVASALDAINGDWEQHLSWPKAES